MDPHYGWHHFGYRAPDFALTDFRSGEQVKDEEWVRTYLGETIGEMDPFVILNDFLVPERCDDVCLQRIRNIPPEEEVLTSIARRLRRPGADGEVMERRLDSRCICTADTRCALCHRDTLRHCEDCNAQDHIEDPHFYTGPFYTMVYNAERVMTPVAIREYPLERTYGPPTEAQLKQMENRNVDWGKR